MIVDYLDKSKLGLAKSTYDFSNFFTIGYDSEQDLYFYGVNKTIYFKTPPNGVNLDNVFTYYKILYGDTWPLISHKNYQTVKLWWMVCRFNNISNPLIAPVIDTRIKILNPGIVESIIKAQL